MRKLLISLLLASAAASPALAAPDNNPRQQTREERQQARQQARSNNQQAREQQRVDRPANLAPAAPTYAPRSNGFVRPDASAAPRPNFDPAQRDAFLQQRQQLRDDRVMQRPDPRDALAQRIDQQRQAMRDRQASRPTARMRPPVISPVARPDTQPPPPMQQRYTAAPQWNTNWRNNSTYDWRNYRNRHRSLFHFGYYYDPFGWGYQPYSIGWRLWPSYYSSNFWINDPWQYRLPYPPPGTQWVRYYDDALLVDMWSGQVVDVIYGFFW